jgi:ActR/RegA family two-component response regulator
MAGKETVLLVGQNLFFLGRVESLAEARGYDLSRAADEASFWRHFHRQKPALLLVDLEGDEDTWHKVLEGVQLEKQDIKIVAFGPHENVNALERARGLGCDLVLNKGEFNRDLPKIFDSIAVNE